VRQRAVEVLGKISGLSPEQEQEVLAQQKALEKQKRIEELIAKSSLASSDAVRELVKIGQPSVEPLIAALKDKNLNVKFFAAKVLRQIGGLSPEQEQDLAKQERNYEKQKEEWIAESIPLFKAQILRGASINDATKRVQQAMGIGDTEMSHFIRPVFEQLESEGFLIRTVSVLSPDEFMRRIL